MVQAARTIARANHNTTTALTTAAVPTVALLLASVRANAARALLCIKTQRVERENREEDDRRRLNAPNPPYYQRLTAPKGGRFLPGGKQVKLPTPANDNWPT